jgi:hypothetical protein
MNGRRESTFLRYTANTEALQEPGEVVKAKYGQAALRVPSGGSSCYGATAATAWAATQSLPICMTLPQAVQVRKRPGSPRQGAEILLHWRN